MWKAFDRLTTTRPRAFGIGPISYREGVLYADELGLDANTGDFMWEVIRRVDTWYLKAVSQKMEEERQKSQAQARAGRKDLPHG